MTLLSEEESGAGGSFADSSAAPAYAREQTDMLKRITAKRLRKAARDFMAGRILSEPPRHLATPLDVATE
jgi:hypothetical protein